MSKTTVTISLDIEQIVFDYYINTSQPGSDVQLINQTDNCIFFADPHNHPVKLWVNMTSDNGLELKMGRNFCWWDRCQFSTHPIGIPIEKVDGEYVVYGMFCSFCCALSFILQHANNPRFKSSRELLYAMYTELFGKSVDLIPPAPHWSLLKDFGGTLDITEWRMMLGHTHLIETPNIVVKNSTGYFKEILR